MNTVNGNITGNHFVRDWHVLLEVLGIGMGEEEGRNMNPFPGMER